MKRYLAAVDREIEWLLMWHRANPLPPDVIQNWTITFSPTPIFWGYVTLPK